VYFTAMLCCVGELVSDFVMNIVYLLQKNNEEQCLGHIKQFCGQHIYHGFRNITLINNNYKQSLHTLN